MRELAFTWPSSVCRYYPIHGGPEWNKEVVKEFASLTRNIASPFLGLGSMVPPFHRVFDSDWIIPLVFLSPHTGGLPNIHNYVGQFHKILIYIYIPFSFNLIMCLPGYQNLLRLREFTRDAIILWSSVLRPKHTVFWFPNLNKLSIKAKLAMKYTQGCIKLSRFRNIQLWKIKSIWGRDSLILNGCQKKKKKKDPLWF